MRAFMGKGREFAFIGKGLKLDLLADSCEVFSRFKQKNIFWTQFVTLQIPWPGRVTLSKAKFLSGRFRVLSFYLLIDTKLQKLGVQGPDP